MKRRLGSLFIVGMFFVGAWIAPFSSSAAQQQTDISQQVIAALNEWRLEHSLWPLKPNTTLDTLALGQAEYLMSLPDLPDDMHAGRSGEDPKVRAKQAGWPSYSRPDQIAIGEIAYAGSDVETAIRWWKHSSIHMRTVENPAYREVGVAVLPHRFGYLFIVVLGSRPNVLPGLVESGTLYLSDEEYQWAASGAGWVYDTQQFRLFDSEGRPLSDGWQPWTLKVTLPGGTGDRLFVLYTSGAQQTITEVRLDVDRVLLPAQSAAMIATPTLIPTPFPTLTPTLVVTSTGEPGVILPAPSPTFTPTPEPAALPDVLVIYDSRSLTLVNVSEKALDFSRLALAQGSLRLAVTSWQGQWLTVPLTAFPAQDCLQVWSWAESVALNPPSKCRIQRSVITLAADRLFWTKGSFEVHQGDTLLATCPAGSGECAVDLP